MRSLPLLVAISTILLCTRTGRCQLYSADTGTVCRNVYYGNRPHPTDCTRYFLCQRGTGTADQCAAGFVFNSQVLRCVSRNEYRCPTESTRPGDDPWVAYFCRDQATELIRNPVNCTQFLDCVRKPEANYDCPPGKVFNLDYQDCFPGNGRTCVEESLAGDICAGKLDGSYAHPYRCNRFVTCVGGEPRMLDTCPAGYVFEEGRLRCFKGDLLKCSSLL